MKRRSSIKPEEFDEQFDRYLKERFGPFRDKERPSDYARTSPLNNEEKTSFTQVVCLHSQPWGGGRPHRQLLEGRRTSSCCCRPGTAA